MNIWIAYADCWCISIYFMQHLEAVIRAKIPSIVAMINKTIDEIEAQLDKLGRPIGGDAGVRTTVSW